MAGGPATAGRPPGAPSEQGKGQALNKQFMVLKMVVGAIGAAMTVIPLGGLLPSFEMAEQLRARLLRDEPDSVFLIQEVGAA